MRLFRMFGLAVMATVIAMAFVGATSAVAVTELEEVVLCNQNTSPCPAGHDFGAGTVLHGELKASTNAVLLSSIEVTCELSTMLGTTTSLLIHGEITALALANCHSGDLFCKATVEHLNFLFKGELNAFHTGYEVLVTEKGTNGRPQIKIVCGKFMECDYGEPNILFSAEPDATDTVLSVLQELTGLGPLCGAIAHPVWHAKYLIRCLEGSNLVGCWLETE